MSSTFQRRRGGFTLIELLVVLGIMVFATGLMLGVGGGGEGAALGSAQRVLSGMARGARGQAVLKNTRTRLIIHADPGDLDKFGRFAGIVCEETGGSGRWVAATAGIHLPDGIYFDPDLSGRMSGGNWSAANTMRLDYPRATAKVEGTGERFHYYEFNANGTTADPNAWIVFRAAALDPASLEGGDPSFSVDPGDELIRAALIVRRAGTTVAVTDPASIAPVVAAAAARSEID